MKNYSMTWAIFLSKREKGFKQWDEWGFRFDQFHSEK